MTTYPLDKPSYFLFQDFASDVSNKCTTFTPQIKGYSQCMYRILHWFWNFYKIYA